MAKISLEKFLNIHQSIVLDTMIFIYQFEDHPQFSKLTNKIFQHLENKKITGHISTISLLEILIRPRKEKQWAVALEYNNLLCHSPYLNVVDVTAQVANLASSIRVKYNLPTPDSIIVATGLSQKATGLITADKRLMCLQEIDVFVL